MGGGSNPPETSTTLTARGLGLLLLQGGGVTNLIARTHTRTHAHTHTHTTKADVLVLVRPVMGPKPLL